MKQDDVWLEFHLGRVGYEAERRAADRKEDGIGDAKELRRDEQRDHDQD